MNQSQLAEPAWEAKRRRIDPALLLVGLIALFVILPLSRPGLPATADTPIHFYRALEFSQSWVEGVMYPRWAPHLAYGYGYPLWDFAPPLPYIIPALFLALGASLETGFKFMIFLAAFAYALGAYLFVKQSLGTKAGLIAAAIYSLAPFALREALLYGGNYPQYMAIALFPWLLWSLERLNRRQSWGNIVLTALVYGAIILCHLFHALIITPVALAYAILIWFSEKGAFHKLTAPATALLLGLLWTAFFWLPAFVERNFTRATEDVFLQVSPVFSRFLNWAELLAWPKPLDAGAANPWIPFSLGAATVALAVAGIAAFVKLALNKKSPGIWMRGFFFGALLLVCLLMMLPLSTWLWLNIPLLGVAEFPWRFLGLTNLSLAFLGGASILLVQHFSEKIQVFYLVLALGLVIISSAVYLYPPRPFIKYEPSIAAMARYELATQTIGSTTLGEYLPLGVKTKPTGSPLADKLIQGEQVEKFDYDSLPQNASAQALTHNAISDSYLIESSQPFSARFFTFYFPGWQATIDGKAVMIETEAKTGFIRVPVPAGEHQVQVNFTDTVLRKISNWLALLTIVLIIGFSLWQAFKRTKYQPSPSTKDDLALNRQAFLALGGGLLILLLLKTLVIDRQTNWFRQHSPRGQVIGAQHSLYANLDNQVSLLGYSLNPAKVSSGQTLRLVLYWLAEGPLEKDYRSFAHLDSPIDQRTLAGSDNFHPGDSTAQIDIPTSTWDTEHYIRDEHFINLPADLPPVTLNLRAGLYDSETGRRLPLKDKAGDAILLQNVEIAAGKKLSATNITNVVEHYFGEHIQLLGYDWDERTGDLTLYWQSTAPLTEDYVIFVQLLDSAGNLAWGFDSPPLEGLYPTSTWQANYPFAETRSVEMSNLPAGEYTLLVGMYNPQTLQRLGEVALLNIAVD